MLGIVKLIANSTVHDQAKGLLLTISHLEERRKKKVGTEFEQDTGTDPGNLERGVRNIRLEIISEKRPG